LHNVNDIVMDTLTLREHQLNVENIQIVKELGEELPKINVDFHDVQRVFINMLNNAQHAFRQLKDGREKRIYIRTFVQGDALLTQFQDNGPGISAENQAKIFQAFFTTKPAGEGTGLGLSLSTEIVRGHGGEILLESCEGVGATFTIVLPIAKNHNGKF
jgi:signal transduction histidine kinase